MTDRRSWPANARVAASELRGTVEGVRFVTGTTLRVSVPVADLCAAPDGPRDRQLLFGQDVEVFETRADWSFVRAGRDGYVGYVRAEELSTASARTHRVFAPATHGYTRPDMKSPDRMRLSHGSELAVSAEVEGFVETDIGFVPSQHVGPIETRAPDLLAVARLYAGVPYLWGGNSIWGIDCSGLVQAACLACGLDCPGDSDQQITALGEAVGGELQQGDLLFWKGHVGFVDQGNRLLHANAHHMMVVSEPLEPALVRIESAAGPILSHRRTGPGS